MVKRGFTLLELIVVIVIIGILASIALPQYMKIKEKSKAAEGLTILSAIRKAQFAYNLEHGCYANRLSDLIVTYPTSRYFTPVNFFNPNNSIYGPIIGYFIRVENGINCYALLVGESDIYCQNIDVPPHSCLEVGFVTTYFTVGS